MPERPVPTQAEVESYLADRRNWGRWGENDEVGAINLITQEKRLQALSLARKGRVVSMAREMPKVPAANNPNPAQHFMRKRDTSTGSGAATDFYGTAYHGQSTTHLDALCHIWDKNGMWGGKKPGDVLTFDGSTWGAVQNWKDGIVTRGVLIDIPKFRGVPYVTADRPVHGWELEDAAAAQGVTLAPGDAVVVYSGREAWDRENPIWGSGGSGAARAGLHASCLPFLRDNDASILVWDMMDAAPNEYGLEWTVHCVIFSYGVALVDNAMLGTLAQACAEEQRYEFMLVLAPLIMIGGTGSPLNPLAFF